MPHGLDIDEDADESHTYECLQCGNLVESETHPGECQCGGSFQSQAKSLE